MIQAILGDITQIEVEAIVNAANGIGILGSGVAGAIRMAAGLSVQDEAKEVYRKNGKPIEEGECYSTSSGLLKDSNGVKTIYHAVTMRLPGGPTSLDIVSRVTKNVFESALADGIKSIAIPALGTGVGGLDKSSVARIMTKIAKNFSDSIDICIVDIDISFIKEVEKNI